MLEKLRLSLPFYTPIPLFILKISLIMADFSIFEACFEA
jgi:hypothetical protein